MKTHFANSSILYNNNMKYGLIGLALGLVLSGCGGQNGVDNKMTFGITEMNGVNYGVSVDSWKDGASSSDSECRDDSGTTWCSTTSQSDLKEIRFVSDEGTHDYDYFNLFFKNSSSTTSNVRVHLYRGGYTVIDRVVSLTPGQKLRIGTIYREGDFYGANGF